MVTFVAIVVTFGVVAVSVFHPRGSCWGCEPGSTLCVVSRVGFVFGDIVWTWGESLTTSVALFY